MNPDLLETQKRAVVEKFGPWTANNIHISGDVYTMGKRVQGDEIKLRRIVQIVVDITRRPLGALRILDLGCHEGLYAIEFARHGAEAVGIEGREMHIEKARFVKDVLGLNKLSFYQDDVRNLSERKYGRFDVVLCLGILYHLDMPDVFSFMEQLGEVCKDVTIIDTRIAYGPTTSYDYKGTRYWGHRIREHRPGASVEEKIRNYAASLDNPSSFYLSRTSLFCMLSRLGFTSVYECYVPSEPAKPIDRITLVAVKGSRPTIINSPLMGEYPMESAPEKFVIHKVERMYGKMYRMSRLLIPRRVRVFMKNRGVLFKLFRPYKYPDTKTLLQS